MRNNSIAENCDKYTTMERRCKMMKNLSHTFVQQRIKSKKKF